MSFKRKKIMVKIRKYRKRVLTIVAVIVASVFMVNAESNYLNPNFSDLTESISAHQQVTQDIESYNISYFFTYRETGNASWYGKRFHNRKTASGERYNMFALTAAHKKLPLGSIVRVKNNKTNETVLLKINDRGPYVKKRIIDLSYASAQFVSGATNPNVQIETLLAQDNSHLIPNDDKYFFGFSYDLPLVCIPSKVINFVYNTDDFDTVVAKYNEILKENPGKLVYIFTDAGKIKYKYNNLQENYYVGIFNPDEDENIIVENEMKQ
jgi:rare lipoprotein A (peptidoglycan hydrolase)